MKILGLINSTTAFCLAAATVSIGTTLNTAFTSAATVHNSPAEVKIATVKYLEGFYVTSDFSVEIFRQGGKYYYNGTMLETQANLKLSNPTISRTKSQHTYTWNNKGTKYRVSWNTNDTGKIYLQVIEGSRIILDRSLQWQKKEDFV